MNMTVFLSIRVFARRNAMRRALADVLHTEHKSLAALARAIKRECIAAQTRYPGHVFQAYISHGRGFVYRFIVPTRFIMTGHLTGVVLQGLCGASQELCQMTECCEFSSEDKLL
jgi:predicted YcjX-like family ATPase